MNRIAKIILSILAVLCVAGYFLYREVQKHFSQKIISELHPISLFHRTSN